MNTPDVLLIKKLNLIESTNSYKKFNKQIIYSIFSEIIVTLK